MKANAISLIISCAPLLASLNPHQVQAQWVMRPSKELQERTPGLVHETFESPAMKSTVGYSVVLPPSYAEGSKRYPVVYWLHGGGGNECSSLFTSHAWRKLFASSKIQEVILVYPNGFRSGYMDHHGGKVMVETMIIRELIPRIDKRYRTIASRAGRAVHGFSMGASGSLKFTIKYPDMFCAAVAYGGGAIDLANTTNPFVLDILERNLKSDAQRIRQNNTYHFLEENQPALGENGTRFFLICGDKDSWKDSAVKFQAALKAKDIPCDLTLVPDAGHDLPKTFAAQGEAAALFQDEAFKEMSNSLLDSAVEIREHVIERSSTSKLTYRCIVSVPAEYDADHDRSWPMILFLHGGGLPKPAQLKRTIRTLIDLPAIVVAPLCPPSSDSPRYTNWDWKQLGEVVREISMKYRIDPKRRAVIGFSMGGSGAWELPSYEPELFAKSVVIAGVCHPWSLRHYPKIPVWVFVGAEDYMRKEQQETVTSAKRFGVNVVETVWKGADHGRIFRHAMSDQRMLDWLVKDQDLRLSGKTGE